MPHLLTLLLHNAIDMHFSGFRCWGIKVSTEVLFLLEDGCAFLCPLMAKILHFLLLMRSLIPPRKHSSLTSATEVNFQSTYSKYHQIVGYCFLTFLAGVVCLQVRSLSSQFYCHNRVRQVLVSNARLPFLSPFLSPPVLHRI